MTTYRSEPLAGTALMHFPLSQLGDTAGLRVRRSDSFYDVCARDSTFHPSGSR